MVSKDEYCFLVLLMQATTIIIGIAILRKVKSVIVFAMTQLSWGHGGRQLINDLTCFVL